MPTKLKNSYKIKGRVLDSEAIATSNTAKTLAGHGATIPAGTTQILIIPETEIIYWHPTGTPSSTFGHEIAPLEPFVLEHNQFKAKLVAATGTPQWVLVYFGYPT